jgi:hypothetical protein
MTPAEGVFIMFSAGAKQTALDRLSTADRPRTPCSRETFSAGWRSRT